MPILKEGILFALTRLSKQVQRAQFARGAKNVYCQRDSTVIEQDYQSDEDTRTTSAVDLSVAVDCGVWRWQKDYTTPTLLAGIQMMSAGSEGGIPWLQISSGCHTLGPEFKGSSSTLSWICVTSGSILISGKIWDLNYANNTWNNLQICRGSGSSVKQGSPVSFTLDPARKKHTVVWVIFAVVLFSWNSRKM